MLNNLEHESIKLTGELEEDMSALRALQVSASFMTAFGLITGNKQEAFADAIRAQLSTSDLAAGLAL
jgi:hypothetical protein